MPRNRRPRHALRPPCRAPEKGSGQRRRRPYIGAVRRRRPKGADRPVSAGPAGCDGTPRYRWLPQLSRKRLALIAIAHPRLAGTNRTSHRNVPGHARRPRRCRQCRARRFGGTADGTVPTGYPIGSPAEGPRVSVGLPSGYPAAGPDSASTTAPTTTTAGGRRPSAASANRASGARTTCWWPVVPLEITAPGVSPGRPPATSAATMAPRWVRPMSTQTVPPAAGPVPPS